MKCNRCQADNIKPGLKFCPFCYNDLIINTGFTPNKKNNKKELKDNSKDDIVARMLAKDTSNIQTKNTKAKKLGFFAKRKLKKAQDKELMDKLIAIKDGTVGSNEASNALKSLFKPMEEPIKENKDKEKEAEEQFTKLTNIKDGVNIPKEVSLVNEGMSLEANLNDVTSSKDMKKSEPKDLPPKFNFNIEEESIKKESFFKKFFTINKSNVKLWAIVGASLFVLIIGGIILKIVISNNKDNAIKRTIMIYMVGSDLESTAGLATSEMTEMLSSKFDESLVNLVIYTGGSTYWSSDIPIDKNAVYKVSNGSLIRQNEYNLSSMGESDSLAKFIQYSYDNYKASRYDLILWGNGGGVLTGYGKDITSNNDALSLKEIKNALNKTPFKNNNKLELIGIDACLMGGIETAYSLKDYADYMVASEETIISSGWDYSFLGKIKKDTENEELAKLIVDTYYDSLKSYSSVNDAELTLSAIKLSEIDNVIKALDTLLKSFDGELTTGLFSNIALYRNNAKNFGRFTDTYLYDIVDFYDLIDRFEGIPSEASANLKTAINNSVLYQKSTVNGAFGLSIYFPYENLNNINEKLTAYTEIGFSTKYTDFIKKFVTSLNGSKITSWNLSDIHPLISANKTASITLDNNILANYSNSSYIIFEKIDDSYYVPRYTSENSILSNNVVSGKLVTKELNITSNDGMKIGIGMVNEIILTDTYSKLLTNLRLNKDTTISGLGQITVDEVNPNGKLINIVPITNDQTLHFAPKKLVNYNEYNSLSLIGYKYRLFNSDGSYNSNFVSSFEEYSIDFPISEGINTSLKDMNLSKEYYVLFKLVDSQNTAYYTNITRVS